MSSLWLLIPFCILFSVYCTHILLLILGWLKTKEFTLSSSPPSVFISLIIPVRNEQDTLPSLIRSMKSQKYNHTSFEVLFINDHSGDKTEKLLKQIVKNTPNCQFYNLPHGHSGKKDALELGISKARGELIVTTDADCTHHPMWLHTLAEFYEHYKPKLIVGPVSMKNKKGFLASFQQMEMLTMAGATAGAIKNGNPIMCNGANLAFQKEIFVLHKDPLNKKYSSGDDIFLLMNIKKHYSSHEIQFLKNRNLLVYTNPAQTMRNFIHQRKRWISKSTGYNDFDTLFSSLTVYFTSFMLVLTLFLSLLNSTYLVLFAIAMLMKSIEDGIFYTMVASYYKRKKYFLLILPFQVLYIIYVSFLPVFLLRNSIMWKGRAISK